jgi:hypothetical protein
MSQVNLASLLFIACCSGAATAVAAAAAVVVGTAAIPALVIAQHFKNKKIADNALQQLAAQSRGAHTCKPTCTLNLDALSHTPGLSLDQAKANALLQLQSCSIRNAETTHFNHLLMPLLKATTHDEFQVHHMSLSNYLKIENTLAVRDQAVLTATQAAKKLGFDKIRVFTVNNDTLSIVATNKNDTSIINELHVTPTAMPELQTEVHGAKKGECHQILDSYLGELGKNGIHLQQPGKRQDTGGIATLFTTKRTLQPSQPTCQQPKARRRAAQKAKVNR